MPAAWMILQNSRELPSAMGGSFGVQFDHRVVNAVARERGEDVFDGVDLDIALGERRGAVRLRDIFPRAPRSPACRRDPRGGNARRCWRRGRMVMFTRLPLCRPMPEKLAEFLRVC